MGGARLAHNGQIATLTVGAAIPDEIDCASDLHESITTKKVLGNIRRVPGTGACFVHQASHRAWRSVVSHLTSAAFRHS